MKRTLSAAPRTERSAAALLGLLLIFLSSLAAAAVVTLPAAEPLRPLVTFWFLLVCPGLAVVRLLRLDNPLAEWIIGIGLSLALDTLVAGVMVITGYWSPNVGLLALIAISLTAAALHLAQVSGWLATSRVIARRDWRALMHPLAARPAVGQTGGPSRGWPLAAAGVALVLLVATQFAPRPALPSAVVVERTVQAEPTTPADTPTPVPTLAGESGALAEDATLVAELSATPTQTPSATGSPTPVPSATVAATSSDTPIPLTDTPAGSVPTVVLAPSDTAVPNDPGPLPTDTPPGPPPPSDTPPAPGGQPTTTPSDTPIRPATPTPTSVVPPSVSPSATGPATATRTLTPLPSATPTNTFTPIPSATYTASPLPTATNTPTPSATVPPPTMTNTSAPPTATNTPLPTETFTPIATDTPVPLRTISGRTKGPGDQGVGGVLIVVTNVGVTSTGGDGGYSVGGLPSGNYLLVPLKAGCWFSPGSRWVDATQGDSGGNDFRAHCLGDD